jgi:hypothetical protein
MLLIHQLGSVKVGEVVRYVPLCSAPSRDCALTNMAMAQIHGDLHPEP